MCHAISQTIYRMLNNCVELHNATFGQYAVQFQYHTLFLLSYYVHSTPRRQQWIIHLQSLPHAAGLNGHFAILTVMLMFLFMLCFPARLSSYGSGRLASCTGTKTKNFLWGRCPITKLAEVSSALVDLMYQIMIVKSYYMAEHCYRDRAKRWSLGCMNSHLAARGSKEAGFTQPRDNLLADPCTVTFSAWPVGLRWSLINEANSGDHI